MRAVVQRVTKASVTIDGELYSAIGAGFLVLLGIHEDDTPELLPQLCRKIAGLRVFEDENGKMNLSLAQVGGEILLVSQFTLYGDCSHGYRPSFVAAARPEKAVPIYEKCISTLRGLVGEDKVKTGVFGADMKVELLNDGPVTIIMDTDRL